MPLRCRFAIVLQKHDEISLERTLITLDLKMISSVSMKKHKKKSTIWAHFDEMNVSNRAKCVYCSLPISFSGGSSGNLKRHLRLKHPEIQQSDPRRDDDGSYSMKIEEIAEIPVADTVFEITEETADDEGSSTPIKDSAKRLTSPPSKNVKKIVLGKNSSDAKCHVRESVHASTLRKHEYDFFGEYVSSALKTLPPENAITALAEIMEVISREKMAVLVHDSSKQ